jgi:NAD(P)-dependent dehydrogenase (short-subunit alcohol dehydrogenase family)
MKDSKIWLITGASQGLGLILAKTLLQNGYRVAGSARDLPAIESALGSKTDSFLPIVIALGDENTIQFAVRQTLDHFGRIDVLVNNAGYGQSGTIEELNDQEVRDNFSVNVFGLLNVTRAVLPVMREQNSGRIFNLSAIGGFSAGYPGLGIYAATKFAVAGLSEALSEEVKPFGIKVTIVYPGFFRTNFLSAGSLQVAKNPNPAYLPVHQAQHEMRNSMDGKQSGDPEKLAGILIYMSENPDPALHLFLGVDAMQVASDKIKSLQAELTKWEKTTISTSFDA